MVRLRAKRSQKENRQTPTDGVLASRSHEPLRGSGRCFCVLVSDRGSWLTSLRRNRPNAVGHHMLADAVFGLFYTALSVENTEGARRRYFVADPGLPCLPACLTTPAVPA